MFILSAFQHTARLSTVLQILIFLPLTLATLSTPAFLSLSLLLTVHSLIHSTMNVLVPALQASLPFLQVKYTADLHRRTVYLTIPLIAMYSGSITPSIPSLYIQYVFTTR